MNKEKREIKNLVFEFTPEYDVIESTNKEGTWLKIGGTALEEGISRNKNIYSYKNLKENDGRSVKWLVGHPKSNIEEHIVGNGKVYLDGAKLKHEGMIRNTANHPDVVEAIKDKFLGPSIHASAEKVVQTKEGYVIEGLSIKGIGLVAFQGVKNATIDYAIAESFERAEEKVIETDLNNDKGDKMSEEEKPAEKPAEEKVEETPSEAKPQESVSIAEIKAIKEELASLKEIREELNVMKSEKKNELVESIVALNKDLKKEDLVKESQEKLELIREYETKLSKKTESSAIVEEDEKHSEGKIIEQKDGTVSMSTELYESFNKEIRDRVR